MAARIRKGDTVVVISGAHKGRRGEVLRMQPKADRAVVQGVAMATRHIKPRGMAEPGGIREQEAAIHVSNLMLVDPTEREADQGRVPHSGRWAEGARRQGDGRSDRELRSKGRWDNERNEGQEGRSQGCAKGGAGKGGHRRAARRRVAALRRAAAGVPGRR